MRRRELLTVGVFALSGCVSEATELADKATGRWDKKQRIVTKYHEGFTQYNEGVQTVEVAVSHEDWSIKEDRLGPSIEQFGTATDRFRTAEQGARAINHGKATELCSLAVEKAELMEQVAQTALDSAEAFSADNPQKGDRLWQEFKRLRDKANQMELPPTHVLARVLGVAEE